jgi:parallel beta-helix repeat protein
MTTHQRRRRGPVVSLLGSMFLLLALVAPARAAGLTRHVSSLGNDRWSGTLAAPVAAKTDGPFATIERARDEVRRWNRAGRLPEGATVLVHAGTYELEKTLVFGTEDSGSATAPVVYRAAPGEKVVVIGGRRITGFKPLTGAIVRADVAAQGFKDVAIRDLIIDGQRQPLARYPNFVSDNPYGGGWAFADGTLVPMYQDVPGEVSNTLHYKARDARTWTHPDEVEVFVFPRYNWWNNIVRVKSVDTGKRLVTLVGDASYPIRPGDRYYFQNAREELDAPGEWYHDRRAGTLDLWPPRPLEGREVYAPRLVTLIRLDPGTRHVTLRGFVLECATGEAVSLHDTVSCLVAGNTIRNVGDYNHGGVGVTGGKDNRVTGNDIYEIGSHGVGLDGGDRKTLTAAGNVADNNYIHHFGVAYKQGVGILLTGVGNRAEHNLIHDGPRMGIMFSGNNLVISNNEIRHMNLETEDTGAVYTGGRDWISSRGTLIKNNYFHDMLGFGKDAQGRWVSPHFAWGVYLDDNTGGVDVIGNIVVRCSQAGLHLHNGRDNVIRDNVLVDNGEHQFEYSGWTAKHSYWKEHLKTMIQGYNLVHGQPAWKAMRGMDLDPRKAVLPDGTIMSGNVFERNIVAYSGEKPTYVRLSDVNFEKNPVERNLVWHHGRPIKTGQVRPGKDLSGELLPNPGFARGRLGELPEGWQWQVFPRPDAKAALVSDPTTTRGKVLRIDAARAAEKPRDNVPIVVSREFQAKPGHSYRLRARFRSERPGATAQFMLQGYVANVFFWANYPNEVKVGKTWAPAELVFTIPGPGQNGYNSQMGLFRARVDFPDAAGALFVSDVSLHEVEMLDEWASWQSRGMDKGSVVADPKFVDPAKDDYRLKPDSPAFALGFKPIPVEQIGPYRDELRASWPIVEAPGAREHPVKVPQDQP